MLLNFKRSAALLYKSMESTESGPEQGKVIKCNRVLADCSIRKQRFDNLIFVVDYLTHFSRFRRSILMLIAVSLMFCNVLNSEILESSAVTLKQVLVAVTNSANRTNCVRNKILQPVRTGNSVGDDFYRECDRKVCG